MDAVTFRQAQYDLYGRPVHELAYATVDDLRARLVAASNDYDAILKQQLLTASRIVEHYCRRVFYPYEGVYYLESNVSRLVLPDDLLSLAPPPEPWPGETGSRTPHPALAPYVADLDYQDPEFLERAQNHWENQYRNPKPPPQPLPYSFTTSGQNRAVDWGLSAGFGRYTPVYYLWPTHPPHRAIHFRIQRDPFRTAGHVGPRGRTEYIVRGIFGSSWAPIAPEEIRWATLYVAQTLQQMNDTKELQVDTIEWQQILYPYLIAYQRPLTQRQPALL